MSEIKAQFTEIYKSYFLGKKIMKLEINMITDEYLEYEEGKTWITEGGVEMKLDDDTIISFSYDNDSLQFICVESSLLPFISEYDYYPIEIDSQSYYDIIEETIVDVAIDWINMTEIDYTGAVLSEEPFAVGFVLKMENGSQLQIASVLVKMNVETQLFSKIDYAIEGNILVSLCNPIVI
jgi:hypothetical protein